MDAFFDTSGETEDGEGRRPQELLEDISSLARLPIKLNNEQMRLLNDGRLLVLSLLHFQT